MKKVVINKEDLIENVNKIKSYAERNGKDDNGNFTKIIAVVKGNGYGLDIVKYTKFLIDQGIDFFAVSTLEEVLKIRQAGINHNLINLSSTCIEQEVEELIKNNVIITLGSEEAVNVAERVAERLNKKVRAHIKIDTGFGRYGFLYNNRDKMVECLKNIKNIKIEGIFTHFSIAFFDDKYTKLQFKRFIDCVEVLKMNEIPTGMLHVCNSSAFVKFPNMHLNAVRIGSAFLGRLLVQNTLGLKKIGYLQSNVSEIKILPKDFYIGYGNVCKTKKETKVAVIPCGYMDGVNMQTGTDSFRFIDKLRYSFNDFKSFFKSKYLTVKINDKNYKILGRIGTYHVIADITGSDVKIGDNVVFNMYPGYVDSSIRREYL